MVRVTGALGVVHTIVAVDGVGVVGEEEVVGLVDVVVVSCVGTVGVVSAVGVVDVIVVVGTADVVDCVGVVGATVGVVLGCPQLTSEAIESRTSRNTRKK